MKQFFLLLFFGIVSLKSHAQVTLLINDKAVKDKQVFDAANISSIKFKYGTIKQIPRATNGLFGYSLMMYKSTGEELNDVYDSFKGYETIRDKYATTQNKPILVWNAAEDAANVGYSGKPNEYPFNLKTFIKDRLQNRDYEYVTIKARIWFREQTAYNEYGDAIILGESPTITINVWKDNGVFALEKLNLTVSTERLKKLSSNYKLSDYQVPLGVDLSQLGYSYETQRVEMRNICGLDLGVILLNQDSQEIALQKIMNSLHSYNVHYANVDEIGLKNALIGRKKIEQAALKYPLSDSIDWLKISGSNKYFYIDKFNFTNHPENSTLSSWQEFDYNGQKMFLFTTVLEWNDRYPDTQGYRERPGDIAKSLLITIHPTDPKKLIYYVFQPNYSTYAQGEAITAKNIENFKLFLSDVKR